MPLQTSTNYGLLLPKECKVAKCEIENLVFVNKEGFKRGEEKKTRHRDWLKGAIAREETKEKLRQLNRRETKLQEGSNLY